MGRPHGYHPLHQFARLMPILRREMGPVGGRSALGQHVGPEREVAFASLPLARAKEAHAAVPGVTANGVVLSVVGGGLRSWSKS